MFETLTKTLEGKKNLEVTASEPRMINIYDIVTS